MRLGVYTALAFLMSSCMTDTNLMYEEPDSTIQNQEVWICYNPESEHHQKICSEECLEEGNPHTFCWVLDLRECEDLPRPASIELACLEVGLP